MYGKKPLHPMEIKGAFVISNGMYCVYGHNNEGVCVDIYKDKTRHELVSMQHGIMGSFDVSNLPASEELLKNLIESMSDEF